MLILQKSKHHIKTTHHAANVLNLLKESNAIIQFKDLDMPDYIYQVSLTQDNAFDVLHAKPLAENATETEAVDAMLTNISIAYPLPDAVRWLYAKRKHFNAHYFSH